MSVTDRAGAVDDTKRPKPCGFEQEGWDNRAAPYVGLFTGFSLDLPKDTPGHIVYLSFLDMHVSAFEAWDPSSMQQGGIRFTIEIPRVLARNEDPGVDIRTTESSFIYLVVAPFVQAGHIRWWVREATIKMGHLDADVDLFLYGWLQWLWVIPGVNFLLLGFNPLADAYATSRVNDELNPPDTSSLQNLIVQALDMWVDDRVGDKPDVDGRFDAAYLRKSFIRTWVRNPIDLPGQSLVNVLPTQVSFGSMIIGAAPVQRNLLIENDGALPALLEDVGITAGAPEFQIVSTRAWPGILVSGDSLIVTVAFDPQAPPGFRGGSIAVTFNRGHQTVVPLLGLAEAPPTPMIRTRPREVVNFGVVVAGQQGAGEVEVFNDGDAPLEVAAPRIEGDAALVAAFAIVTPGPFQVPAQGSTVLQLRFAPPQGGATHYQAQLVLDCNDINQPHLELRLFAVAAAGTLLVMPTAIDFGNTPIDANTPPLPPGLPPTIHRGATRAAGIYNTGAAALTIIGASFQVLDDNGGVSMDYHLWNTDGSAVQQVDQVLQAGGTLTLVIQFLPIVVGLHRASAQIRSDDPTQPMFQISLTGTGV